MKSQRIYKTVLLLHLLITFCSCAHIRSSTSTSKPRNDDDGDGLLKHVDDAMMDVLSSILDGPDSAEDKKSSSEETKRSGSSEETRKTSSSEDSPIITKADNRTTNSFNVQRNSSTPDSVLPRIPIFPGSMFLSPSMASRLTSTMHKRKRMNGNNRSPFPSMGRNMAGIFPQQNSFPLMQRPMPPMLQLGAGRLMAQDFLHRPGMESFLPIMGNAMTRPGSPFGPTGSSGFDTSRIPNSSSFSSNPLLNSPFGQSLGSSSFSNGGLSSSSDLSGGMSSSSALGGGFGGLSGGMSGLGGRFDGLGGMSGLGGGMSGLGGGMSGLGGLGGGLGGLSGGLGSLGGGLGGFGGGLSGLGGGLGGMSGGFGGLGGLNGGLGGLGGLNGGLGGMGGGLGGLGGLNGGLGGLGGLNGGLGGLGGLNGGLGGLNGGLGGLGGFNGGFGGGTSGLSSSLSGMSGLGLQNPALRFGASGSGSGFDFSGGGDSQTSGFGMGSNQDDFNLAQRPLDLAKNSSMSMFGGGNSFGVNPMLGMGLGMGVGRMPVINPLLLQQAHLLGLNRQLLAQARPNPLLLQSLMGGGSPGLTPMIQPGGQLSLQPQNSFLDVSSGRNANSFDNMFRPNRTFDVLSGGVFSGSNREVTKMAGKELPEKARVIIEPVSQLSSPAITEGSTTTLASNQ